jgi:hypothetical protein
MARNPNKARCQVPGCRNWAMRGHTHCRSHRDAELGPRGAGAPAANLNALKTGQHAHPFDPASPDHLTRQLASDPQQLPAYLERAIASIHARTGHPLQTLIATRAALAQLLPLVAQNLFAAGLQDLLRHIPPQRRAGLQAVLARNALPLSPKNKLRLLQHMAAHFKERRLKDGPPLAASDPEEEPHLSSFLHQPPAPQPSDPQQT